MSEDLKSQEEKDNDIYRTFASLLLENGEYHCEHETLKRWEIEDRFLWEEEFLPVS